MFDRTMCTTRVRSGSFTRMCITVEKERVRWGREVAWSEGFAVRRLRRNCSGLTVKWGGNLWGRREGTYCN